MADLRHSQTERCLIERCRSACVSREAQARGSVQDPGVPRRPHFSAAHLFKPLTRNAPRERERLPMTIGEVEEDAMRESHARSPSPGGGGSASSNAASRGGVNLKQKEPPHPDAHLRSRRTLPLQGRVRACAAMRRRPQRQRPPHFAGVFTRSAVKKTTASVPAFLCQWMVFTPSAVVSPG